MSRRTVDPTVWTVTRRMAARNRTGEDARTLYAYVLTCRHSNLIGFFELPLSYIAEDLGWSPQRTRRALELLKEQCFVHYDDGARVIWVPETLRVQPLQNENQVTAAVSVVEALVPTPFFQHLRDALQPKLGDRGYLKPLSELLGKRLSELLGKAMGKQSASPYPYPSPSPEPSPKPEPVVNDPRLRRGSGREGQ